MLSYGACRRPLPGRPELSLLLHLIYRSPCCHPNPLHYRPSTIPHTRTPLPNSLKRKRLSVRSLSALSASSPPLPPAVVELCSAFFTYGGRNLEALPPAAPAAVAAAARRRVLACATMGAPSRASSSLAVCRSPDCRSSATSLDLAVWNPGHADAPTSSPASSSTGCARRRSWRARFCRARRALLSSVRGLVSSAVG